MKTLSMLALALGCAALATSFVVKAASDSELSGAGVELEGSSDAASLPGFPGGRGGASGHSAGGLPRSDLVTHGYPEPLRRYCVEIFREDRQASGIAGPSAFRPGDCVGLFVTLAQSGQPGRGGDGGGFPGFPGGRGGESGGPGGGRGGDGGSLPGLPGGRGSQSGAALDDIAVAPSLVAYCIEVLRTRGWTTSDEYAPSDCAYYLLALDRLTVMKRRGDLALPKQGASRSGRDGPDGPSIQGGIGGRGGRAGSGPGGGRGGAGGIGVGGGAGGAGGAGGSSN